MGLWEALILGYLIGEDWLRLRYLSENGFSEEGGLSESTLLVERRRRTAKRNQDKIYLEDLSYTSRWC